MARDLVVDTAREARAALLAALGDGAVVVRVDGALHQVVSVRSRSGVLHLTLRPDEQPPSSDPLLVAAGALLVAALAALAVRRWST